MGDLQGVGAGETAGTSRSVEGSVLQGGSDDAFRTGGFAGTSNVDRERVVVGSKRRWHDTANLRLGVGWEEDPRSPKVFLIDAYEVS
jgi:hypothetical protein